ALTIIKQNIWFSIIIKLVALILIFPGWLTLWMAVLSDSGAAIIVVLSALRLLKVQGCVDNAVQLRIDELIIIQYYENSTRTGNDYTLLPDWCDTRLENHQSIL